MRVSPRTSFFFLSYSNRTLKWIILLTVFIESNENRLRKRENTFTNGISVVATRWAVKLIFQLLFHSRHTFFFIASESFSIGEIHFQSRGGDDGT